MRSSIDESHARSYPVGHEADGARASMQEDVMRKYLGLTLLLATLVGPLAACEGEIRFYDAPYGDYHQWNGREEHAYRLYLEERHAGYVEFRQLRQPDQDDYWRWRHTHQDADHDRDRNGR